MSKLIIFPDKVCLNCGTKFNRRKYKGLLEQATQFKSRKYCSHECFTKSNKGQNNGNYKSGLFREGKTCLDCNKLIHANCSSVRCHSCSKLGNRNSNYIHGRGEFPYTLEFNKSLKLRIRTRDNFTCQNCGIKEENHYRSNKKVNLYIHHINYDKMNCKQNNLITLCGSCHTKTNFNRDYWQKIYSYTMEGLCLKK